MAAPPLIEQDREEEDQHRVGRRLDELLPVPLEEELLLPVPGHRTAPDISHQSISYRAAWIWTPAPQVEDSDSDSQPSAPQRRWP